MEGEYELDEGELVAVTRPQRRHGKVCARLTLLLGTHCETTGQGEVLCNDTGFLLGTSPDTLRGPDVAVLLTHRLEGLELNGWPDGAPDVVAEVVSPSDRPGEIQRKVGQYLDAGARLVWVLYPERRVVCCYADNGLVQIVQGDQLLDAGQVLPGFSCRLSNLFD